MRIATLLFTLTLSPIVVAHPETSLSMGSGLLGGMAHTLGGADHWLIWAGLGALLGASWRSGALRPHWVASISAVGALYLILHALFTPVIGQSIGFLIGAATASVLMMGLGTAAMVGHRRRQRS